MGTLAGLALVPTAHAQSEEAIEHFEKAVRPVLVEHCVQCHGGEKPKGGLRLDTAEGIRAGAYGDPVAVPGDLEASTIVEVVRYEDPLFAMPPVGKLPDDAIRAIERWVELGAAVPDDMSVGDAARLPWNLVAPVALGTGLMDAAHGAGRDWIDVALEARLKEEGVQLSESAEPLRWLRRVTFDLTGLPPTPEQCRQFEQTEGDRSARAAVVDRLLASPAFGERWARRWLDLMRYAETRAHEFDFDIPNAFEYRDYVIRAFDADVPYDRLVTELLAGDLVEEPRLDPTGSFDESALGTGALFLGEEVHSPVEIRGDQTDRLAHQVEVLSKSVLAMGVACARCHDHKFDPISAEDYHALAGFTLSTAAAQVRFETDEHNRRLAAELSAFLDEVQPTAAEAVAAALEREADALGSVLEAVAPSAGTVSIAQEADRISVENIAALDAAFQAHPPVPRAALLLEDFEAETLEAGGLGPWKRVGDAFMGRPLRGEDTADRPELEPRGEGSVNSYAGDTSSPDTSLSNRFVGTLTSRPFPAVRRYLHLLINGGKEGEGRVEVIDAATGEVLGTALGSRSNRLRHASIDLSEFQDRQVKLRFVDDHTEHWGQIGGDHIVLADVEDADALDAARSLSDWNALLESAHASSVDVARVLAWEPLLRRDRSPSVGTLLAWLTAPPELIEAEPGSDLPPETPIVAYGELDGARWIVNGPAFGPAPVGPMRVVLDVDVDSEEVRVAQITTRASALAHPTWADLRVAPGTKTSQGGSMGWVQAGRTLLSPMFTPESGRLAHLVRGRAKVLWEVAGHRMISGPLHKGVVQTIDTGGDWQWVEQRVDSAAGQVGHLEFTAQSTEVFEIALTAELGPNDPLPSSPGASDWWSRAEADGDLDLSTLSSRAHGLEQAVRDAAELLRTGGVAGRALEDGERWALLRLAEDLARHHPGIKASIAAALEGPGLPLRNIVESRALESRLAPVAIDLDGRDEFILDRGSWRTPGKKASRRAPSALRASSQPLAKAGEGSGRLALAQSLIQSPTKALQRVWVNRLWQAMFSTGLVTTPDDFGAMGSGPSHPEILDQLALDFEASGWSTKGLLRRLALSDAYARSTEPTSSSRELDPLNVLLARMNVRRLEAEEIRDGLLAASGELDGTRFGAPVPIHLTSFMTGRGRPASSGPLDGAGRRSIYLEVRRNFPHPFLTVFDCPSPSTCHGKRTSSNVPAQALTMMNDPFVEERAVHLADLVLAFDDSAQRIDALWLRVLGRRPTDEEQTTWRKYADEAGAATEGSEEDADAWVDLAHVLFNVKDFLFLR